MMIFGSLLGATGTATIMHTDFPVVELGIALSVVVIGAAVVVGHRFSLMASMMLVGFFAVFHGFAHGVEMPATVSGLSYGTGFVLATILLNTIGVGIGCILGAVDRTSGLRLVRVCGVIVSIIGLGFVGEVI